MFRSLTKLLISPCALPCEDCSCLYWQSRRYLSFIIDEANARPELDQSTTRNKQDITSTSTRKGMRCNHILTSVGVAFHDKSCIKNAIHTHAHTHACTHARMHACTHTVRVPGRECVESYCG